jgi:hypothetical protein
MDVDSFSLRLADGRSLDVEVSGPDGATPLVSHHGTPGERSSTALRRGGGGARQPGLTVDVTALTGDYADFVALSFRRALADGIWGWFDDDLASTRPWGFELDGIGVPVVVWQRGQDRMVPFAHGSG